MACKNKNYPMNHIAEKGSSGEKPAKVISICVPFVDVIAKSNGSLVEAGSLQLDSASLYNAEHHAWIVSKISAEIERGTCIVTAGGSSLNTAIEIGANYRHRGVECHFFGPSGSDGMSEILRQHAVENNVQMHLAKREAKCAKCYVILCGNARTMIAQTSAKLAVDARMVSDAIGKMDAGTVVYLCGYTLEATPAGILDVLLDRARRKNAVLCINLSDPGVVKRSFSLVERFVAASDWAIGNMKEAEALYCRGHEGATPSPNAIVDYFNGLGVSYVITNGAGPVIGSRFDAATGRREFVELSPPILSGELNTTGAGDAFAAGVLSEMVLCGSIESMLREGVECSVRRLKTKNEVPCFFIEGEGAGDGQSNR